MESIEALNLIKETRQQLYLWWVPLLPIMSLPEKERKPEILKNLSRENELFIKAGKDVESVCSFLMKNNLTVESRQHFFNILKDVYMKSTDIIKLWEDYVDAKHPLAYDTSVMSYRLSRIIINNIEEVAGIFGIIINRQQKTIETGTPIQPRPDEYAGQQTTKKKQRKMTFRDYIKSDDADSRIEKALNIDVSKYGTKADAFREIISITLGEVISEKDFPSYYVFNDTFKGLISNSDFYRIRNEMLPVSETSEGYNKKFSRNKIGNN